MKKTLNISIASRLFNLEDDAYQKLDQYLSSIKNYFSNNPDKAEIIADIEERIAEHFLESKTGIITLNDVESLIKTMGTVDQFDQPEEKGEAPKTQKTKRLFRDTDDAVVAGVASGIAHYFGIDPIIPRLIFIASVFIGGAGILIYLILWLVVPEAKTASQKLLMHGDPVTLETLSETVRERFDEIKSRDKSVLRRLIVLPFKIIGNIIKFLVRLIPKVLRVFFGVVLVLAGITVLVFAMIGSGFIASGDLMIIENVTLETFIPGFLRYLIIFGTALAVMIPALFAFLGGISLLKKKKVIPSYTALGLLGIWLIALSISGYGIAKVANRYDALANTTETSQQITDTRAITERFEALEIQNGLNVEIIKGTSTSVLRRGRASDIDSIQTTVVNNKLTIERERTENDRFCLLCFAQRDSAEIILAVADPLQSLNVLHGSFARGDLSDSPTINLNIENGSTAELVLKAQHTVAQIIHGSHLSVEGTTTSADLTLENGSVLAAKDLEIIDAKITAIHGSHADISVSETLDAKAQNGSVINYTGNPRVTESEAHGSSIRSEN